MRLREWWNRVRPGRLDEADFDAEIRTHLAMAEQDRIAKGDDPETARHAARLDFGNVTLTTEDARRIWTPRWLEALRNILGDARYAVRTLSRNPAFALTVIGVLTLGIGLTSAVFTMLKGIALTPLAGVERATDIQVIFAETSAGRALRLSWPDYLHIRDNNRSFTGVFGSALGTLYLGKGRASRQISAELVTGNYFEVLGVPAQRGRALDSRDERAPGMHPVVVISDGLWRRDFESDPEIVGRTIEVNNFPLTVVGVTAPGFHGTVVSYDIELFIPVLTAPELGITFGSRETTPSAIMADRSATVFPPYAFLRDGVSPESSAADLAALWQATASSRPLNSTERQLRIVPFLESPGTGPTYILPTLTALAFMGVLVLLIACANISGLMLVRGVSRRSEVAVRTAIGGARTQIVRLLLIESAVLAVPGAVFGLLISWFGIPPMVAYGEWLAEPQRLYLNVNVDGLVIGFAILVATACALVFGLVPALQSSKVDLISVINTDGSPRAASRGRLRSALVVAQVAVSLVLLVGAGLATRSIDAARRADPGFRKEGLTSLELNLRQNGYARPSGMVLYRKLLDAAHAAGVDSATLAAYRPLALLDTPALRVEVEGRVTRPGDDLSMLNNAVGPDYFRTFDIPLVAGREFDDRDSETSDPVVIVNDTMARRTWGTASQAIDKRIRVGDGDWRRVVGVAADLKYLQISERPRPYVYLPIFQSYRSGTLLHTRGPRPEEQLVEQARAIVASVDPELVILAARPFQETLQGSMIFMDLTATMLFAFGITGLGLAALGTYGLVAYTVRSSTREIGIRMALGASARVVVGNIVNRGLRLGIAGAGLGVAGAVLVSTLMRRILYGVSALDAVAFGQAVAAVLLVVAVASLVPAWRASRISPLGVLRHH